MLDDEDELEADEFACDTIRSSSTSFVRGPSWSFGVGSNRDSELSTSGCNLSASSNGTDTNTLDGSRQRSSTSLSESALKLYPTLIINIPTVYLTKFQVPITTTAKTSNNNDKLDITENHNCNIDTTEQTQQTATTTSGDNSAPTSSGVSSSTSSSASSSSNSSAPSNFRSLLQGPQVTTKKAGPSYHAYQVTMRASSGETWSVYRRYSEFYSFHSKLKAVDSKIGKRFKLPPKRTLISKSSTIVQERRFKLEEYLNNIAAYVDRHIPLSCLTLCEGNQDVSNDVVIVEQSSPTIPTRSETIIENKEAFEDTSSRLGQPTPSMPIDIPGNEAVFGEGDFDVDDFGNLPTIRGHQETDTAGSINTQSAPSNSSQSNEKASEEDPDSNNIQQPKQQQQRQRQQQFPQSSDPQTKVRNLFYQFISFECKNSEPVPEMAHGDSIR